MWGGQWSPTRLAIKPAGGVPQAGWNVGLYDALQTEIIAKKLPDDVPGADPDHPEWGPHAGNSVVSPAQLAVSLGGETPQALFLVGYTMLYVQDGADPQTIGTTPAKLTAFDGKGQAVGVVADSANDQITVQNAGVYNVFVALSVKGASGRTATLRLRRNNVAVDGARADAELSAGAAALSFYAQVGCAEGDVLELWAEADQDGALLTVVSGTFAVTRI
jgi:hypothetical protein